MKPTSIFAGSFLLFAVILSSCVPTTTDIDVSWREPSYSGGAFKKILVIVLSEDQLKKKTAETTWCEMIKGKGANAAPGYEVLPPSLVLNKQTLKPIVDQQGFDAVFVAELLGKEQKQEVVAPAFSESSSISSGNAYGIYSNRTVTYSVPEKVVNYEDVYVDSRLFDVATEKVVWHVQTKTVNPQNFDKSVNQIGQAIVGSLSKEKLL
jgi:hypothetical protein